MSRPQIIAAALVASSVLHVALLLAPGQRLRLPVTPETLVEVEIAPPAEEPPAEPAQTPPPVEPVPVPTPAPPARPVPLGADAAVALERALEPLLPATAPPPAAPLKIPSRAPELPGAETIAWIPPARRSPAPQPPGEAYRPALEVPPGPDHQEARAVAESLLQELSTTPSQTPTLPQAPPPQLEIEGPVGEERKVLNQPTPPSVAIRHSADVRLKFFVSPRGEVVRAFPIERGDAELDRAALAYLKQFRFSALPHGDEREQWGTIRVRFRLE